MRDGVKEHAKSILWARSRICAECRKPMLKLEDTSLDHIVPRALGGRTRLANLQLLHYKCNSSKGQELRYFSSSMMKVFKPVHGRPERSLKSDD